MLNHVSGEINYENLWTKLEHLYGMYKEIIKNSEGKKRDTEKRVMLVS